MGQNHMAKTIPLKRSKMHGGTLLAAARAWAHDHGGCRRANAKNRDDAADEGDEVDHEQEHADLAVWAAALRGARHGPRDRWDAAGARPTGDQLTTTGPGTYHRRDHRFRRAQGGVPEGAGGAPFRVGGMTPAKKPEEKPERPQ